MPWPTSSISSSSTARPHCTWWRRHCSRAVSATQGLLPRRLLFQCVSHPLSGRAVDVYDLTVRVTSKGFSADVLPGLVSCIVGLPGNQLRGALRLLLDCHAHWEEQRVGQKEQDEGMEEGELPDNEEEGAGNLQGIDPISRIMVPPPRPYCVVWLLTPPPPCRTNSSTGSTTSRSPSWWAPTTRLPAATRCWNCSHACRTVHPPSCSGTFRTRAKQGKPQSCTSPGDHTSLPPPPPPPPPLQVQLAAAATDAGVSH